MILVVDLTYKEHDALLLALQREISDRIFGDKAHIATLARTRDKFIDSWRIAVVQDCMGNEGRDCGLNAK